MISKLLAGSRKASFDLQKLAPVDELLMTKIRNKLPKGLHLVLVLLISFVMLIFAISWSLQRVVHQTIQRDAEVRAVRWVDAFVENVPDLRQFADTGVGSVEQISVLEALIAGTDIFRFKLFAPDGELKFVSDEVRFQKTDGETHSATAYQVLADRVNLITVKSGQSVSNRPDTFVEAYVPAMSSSNEILGVIEVYVDVTLLANILRNRFYVYGTVLVVISAFFFMVLLGYLLHRKRQMHNAISRDAWLAAILYNAPFEVVIKDTNGKIRAISRNVVEEFGLADADFHGKTTADFLPADIARKYMDADREVVRSGQPSQIEVLEVVEGKTRYSLCSKFPLVDANGLTAGICSITNDITEMKTSEAALAQAQKMEAVGQLTGGMAHDFNNLLSIIMWSAEEMKAKLSPSESTPDQIIQTVKKGAFLTQQLLSFSRKQDLTPQSVDIEKLVLALSQMLARTLGETIEISTNFNTDMTNALVDPNQLENALLNLALNARDAMPDGGTLTIDCSVVTATKIPEIDLLTPLSDEYVLMSISDNGVGMSAEVLNHVFEPFYTTKGVGNGSGLGLSMVYGFAQQSNGQVNITSTLDVGTTVSIFLPCAGPRSQKRNVGIKTKKTGVRKLCILLLEDDVKLRHLARKRLEMMGHCVVGFGCASDAREFLSTEKKVDLLLTDVVLPGGVSGPEFALEIRKSYADVRVLLMSGYPQSSLDESDLQIENLVVLREPFSSKSLSAAIADVMN